MLEDVSISYNFEVKTITEDFVIYDKLKAEIIDEWDQVEDIETLDEHELYDLK